VAVIGGSPGGFGTAQAREDLKRILAVCRAVVLDVDLGIPRVHERFDEDGRLIDETIRAALAEMVPILAAAARTGEPA
jgi:NAD(P)H-dependent FMN reductase